MFTALGTKHEFISGALADRTFTAAERKENAAAPAHSMLNESVLGQMDGMIRHRTGASTASNWAIVAGRGAAGGAGGGAVDVFINDLMAMDSATMETRGAAKATAAAAELDSQAAAKGGPILAELGRERLRMAAEHEAASVALKQQCERAALERNAAQNVRRLAVSRIEDEAAVVVLGKKALGEQFLCWLAGDEFGTDDTGWAPIARAAFLAHEATAGLPPVSFAKKLVLGTQEGGPQKPDLPGEPAGTQKALFEAWLVRKRAQLRAVIAFFHFRQTNRGASLAAAASAQTTAAAAHAVASRSSGSNQGCSLTDSEIRLSIGNI